MKSKNLQNLNITKEENPVYFRLEYSESIESKKNLLSSEMSLLNLIKIIRKYNSLKIEELEIKNKIYKEVKEINSLLRRTRNSFPFLKIPDKAKREEIEKQIITKEEYDRDLESQLREIQEKLKLIER